jgi:hypothetical protein
VARGFAPDRVDVAVEGVRVHERFATRLLGEVDRAGILLAGAVRVHHVDSHVGAQRRTNGREPFVVEHRVLFGGGALNRERADC